MALVSASVSPRPAHFYYQISHPQAFAIIELSMDYRKTYCVYHPAELITNFCRQKQCLLPLCPTCISVHLKYHTAQGMTPVFDNINESMAGCRNLLNESMDRLQTNKSRLCNIESSGKKLSNQVREIIFNARMQLKDLIDEKLNELEKETLTVIERQNRELGLHSQEKLNCLYEKINEQIQKLRVVDAELKGDRNLATLISFLNQGHEAAEKINHEVNCELEVNENYRKDVALNQTVLLDISALIGKLLIVKFAVPNPIQKPQTPQNSVKGYIVQRPDSAHIRVEQNRVFTPQKFVVPPKMQASVMMKGNSFPSNLFQSQKSMSTFGKSHFISSHHQGSQDEINERSWKMKAGSKIDRKLGLTLTNEKVSRQERFTFSGQSKENSDPHFI